MKTGVIFLVWAAALIFLCGDVFSEDAIKGFDYETYASVLSSFVDDDGMVAYNELKAGRDKLDTFVNSLGGLDSKDYQKWGDGDKIAFWINAYNACTLRVIVDNYPIKAKGLKGMFYPKNSIRQIPGVWDKLKFEIMGRKMTLEHIEHKILRKEFDEPRIHMALVCAAKGCPALRNEPYVGKRLKAQLDEQGRKFLLSKSKFRFDKDGRVLYLSPIFKWFGKDFVKSYGGEKAFKGYNEKDSSVLNFISKYRMEVKDEGKRWKIVYLDYDWSLNEKPAEKSPEQG